MSSNSRPNARHSGMSKRLLRLFLLCRALFVTFSRDEKVKRERLQKRIQDNRLRLKAAVK